MNHPIDTFEVNQCVNLLSLAGGVTPLKRVASTGGGEYAGPCPFCGGEDRFRVQPDRQPYGLWMCRNCTGGVWKDAIEFARRLWPGLRFPEICDRLLGSRQLLGSRRILGSRPLLGSRSLSGGQMPLSPARAPAPVLLPAAAPPGDDWQAAGSAFVETCERELWASGGARALNYLRQRGLKDETIRRFRLGYHPADQRCPWSGGPVFIDRGIVIPCFVSNRIWYIKIRRAVGDPKYRCIKGSHPAAIFNADDLRGQDLALFVEGEFDCLLAWQAARDQTPVVTAGSATNIKALDLAAWGIYLIGKQPILMAFDNDAAGDEAAAALCALVDGAVFASLPAEYKDVTEYHLAGGNLRQWITGYLDAYAPETGGLVETALALGGVIGGDKRGYN